MESIRIILVCIIALFNSTLIAKYFMDRKREQSKKKYGSIKSVCIVFTRVFGLLSCALPLIQVNQSIIPIDSQNTIVNVHSNLTLTITLSIMQCFFVIVLYHGSRTIQRVQHHLRSAYNVGKFYKISGALLTWNLIFSFSFLFKGVPGKVMLTLFLTQAFIITSVLIFKFDRIFIDLMKVYQKSCTYRKSIKMKIDRLQTFYIMCTCIHLWYVSFVVLMGAYYTSIVFGDGAMNLYPYSLFYISCSIINAIGVFIFTLNNQGFKGKNGKSYRSTRATTMHTRAFTRDDNNNEEVALQVKALPIQILSDSDETHSSNHQLNTSSIMNSSHPGITRDGSYEAHNVSIGQSPSIVNI